MVREASSIENRNKDSFPTPSRGNQGSVTAVESLPSLVLVYRCSTFFRFSKHLREALQALLATACVYFGFRQAHLILLRSHHKLVYLEAGDPNKQDRRRYLAYLEEQREAPFLAGLYPTASTNLPMILHAGDPMGVIELGVFHPDPIWAKGLVNKTIPLARHIADLIQDSLIKGQKEPNLRRLAVWFETVSAMSSTLDIKKVLHLVTQLAADLLKGRCSILLLEEETRLLIPEVAVGAYDAVLKKKFKALKDREPFPAISQTIKTQRPVVVTPDNLGEMVPGDVAQAFELKWSVFAPIIIRDRVAGIMQVDRPPNASSPGAPFSQEEIEITAAMARETGIAMENAQLIEELAQKEQLLHRLMNKIITAQEDERKRVASDIHDGTIQALLGIWYRLQQVTSQMAAVQKPQLQQEMARLCDDLGLQLRDIRRIVQNLRPFALDNYGLVPAMQAYIDSLRGEPSPVIKMTTAGLDRRLPHDVEITLYRVLQEALANAVKHSQATQVKVHLLVQENMVVLEVADNGKGFSPYPHSGTQAHKRLGLAGIEERALLVGGICRISTRPGHGTRIVVNIPLTVDLKEEAAGLSHSIPAVPPPEGE